MNSKDYAILILAFLLIMATLEALGITDFIADKHCLPQNTPPVATQPGGGRVIAVDSANMWIENFQADEDQPDVRKGMYFSMTAVNALIASHQQDIQANGIVCAPVRMADGSLNIVLSVAHSDQAGVPDVERAIQADPSRFTNNGLNINAFISESYCPPRCGLIGQ